MNYDEGKKMISASSSFEGVSPIAVADMLSHAASPDFRRCVEGGEKTIDDVKTAAAAAYELGRLGLGRESFMGFLR